MADLEKTVALARRLHDSADKAMPYSSCYVSAGKILDLCDTMTEQNAESVSSDLCSFASSSASWKRLLNAHIKFAIGAISYNDLKQAVSSEFGEGVVAV